MKKWIKYGVCIMLALVIIASLWYLLAAKRNDDSNKVAKSIFVNNSYGKSTQIITQNYNGDFYNQSESQKSEIWGPLQVIIDFFEFVFS